MKKIFYSAGIILALLASCEPQDELLVTNPTSGIDSIASVSKDKDTIVPVQTTKPDSIVPGTVNSAVPNNAANYNIIFKQDFSKNTTGTYKASEWKADWNSPSWASADHGYGKIVEEGTNKVLVHTFAAGSFQAVGGYQWPVRFGKGYDELYLSFKVKFSSGFSSRDLNGKLPGLAGGSANGGGNLPTGKDGWSARYMFHGTEINFYLYHPDIYKDAGDSKPVAGKAYYGRGPVLAPGFTLKPGTWYTVTQRIVMNTPGKADGLAEGFINGKLCAVKTGIRFRDISSLKIDQIYFADFFGGSGKPPVKTETISFDDFVVYTYSNAVNIAKGHDANPAGTQIMIPDAK
jgi:hypothetical protein